MEVGLLIVEVKLAAVGALRGQVVGEDLGFEAFGQVVFELELGVEAVGGGPCLGQGEAWEVARGAMLAKRCIRGNRKV